MTFLLGGSHKEGRCNDVGEAKALLTSDAVRLVIAYDRMSPEVRQTFAALVEAVAAS
jgi:hypothetical protein